MYVFPFAVFVLFGVNVCFFSTVLGRFSPMGENTVTLSYLVSHLLWPCGPVCKSRPL